MPVAPVPVGSLRGGVIPGTSRSVDVILEEILAVIRELSEVIRRDALRQEYYTTGEAAALLKCSAFTIRRWIRTGVLQAEKVGSGRPQDTYRIPGTALARMVGAASGNLVRTRRISAAG